MKTKAQTQLYYEGRRHYIGCAKKVEPWFSLRYQACWEKQAAAPRDIFFKPVDYSVIPDPSKRSKVPAKPEPSGRCMTCTASTYSPALFCRDCEPHHNTNNQYSELLSKEEKELVVLEGVCSQCKMRETKRDLKRFDWCHTLSLEQKLLEEKCMSWPNPISTLGTLTTYQCEDCILEQKYWKGRCKCCHDPEKPGQAMCKSFNNTNPKEKFFDKYMGVEPFLWKPVYDGCSGTQENT
ncbi:hypothetical protein DER46DRAFT_579101 [Fusarium sp. MPI-SDFR-AT-0072]|nr:hypothetical protein DER46DRAFT_579101 [Fusarium sp. MPI-SDFR-AT-0072]